MNFFERSKYNYTLLSKWCYNDGLYCGGNTSTTILKIVCALLLLWILLLFFIYGLLQLSLQFGLSLLYAFLIIFILFIIAICIGVYNYRRINGEPYNDDLPDLVEYEDGVL